MWSWKFRYALRGLMWLSRRQGAIASVREIAEGTNIPQKYLESILGELRGSGIVASRKGPQGGYSLNQATHLITLYEILVAIEPHLFQNERGVEPRGGTRPADTADRSPFEAAIVEDLEREITDRLRTITLTDAFDTYLDRKTVLNYVI